ncbi:MAG: MarR family transcriptional regulator [Elusimicrobia bacterium]|nr:MarR family transcriptional regulator [Elusimicrobiota bacterium]
MAQKKFLLRNLPRGSGLDGLAAIYPETDPSAMEVFISLLGTSAELLSSINSALAGHGCSQARFRLLLRLRRAGPGGLHPRELAENLLIERASVTGLVDGLERDGLAERLPFKEDRRSIMVTLTAKGRRFIDSLAPGRLRRVAELMSCLSAVEKHKLAELLDRISANMPAFRKI